MVCRLMVVIAICVVNARVYYLSTLVCRLVIVLNKTEKQLKLFIDLACAI